MIKLCLVMYLVSAGTAFATELGFQWDDPVDPSVVDETRIYLVGQNEPLGVAAMPSDKIYIDMGDMTASRYCFVATHAATDDGIMHESGPSNEVCIRYPSKPQNLIRIPASSVVTVP